MDIIDVVILVVCVVGLSLISLVIKWERQMSLLRKEIINIYVVPSSYRDMLRKKRDFEQLKPLLSSYLVEKKLFIDIEHELEKMLHEEFQSKPKLLKEWKTNAYTAAKTYIAAIKWVGNEKGVIEEYVKMKFKCVEVKMFENNVLCLR